MNYKTNMSSDIRKVFEDYETFFKEDLLITGLPEDLDNEIIQNMGCLGLSMDYSEGVTVQNYLDFFRELNIIHLRQLNVLAAKKQQVRGMLFYVWSDEQAGQLRFNYISDCHTNLPFGAEINLSELETVIAGFLKSHYLNGIPFSELVEVIPTKAAFEHEFIEMPSPPLKVYCERITISKFLKVL